MSRLSNTIVHTNAEETHGELVAGTDNLSKQAIEGLRVILENKNIQMTELETKQLANFLLTIAKHTIKTKL